MSSDTQRYPLSTPDGSAIPMEIIKPHSCLLKTFSNSAATAALSVPSDVEIMSISVTEDCLITFGAAAVSLVDGVAQLNTVFIPKNMRVCVAPKAATYTILGVSLGGLANIQFIEKWAGLAVQTQYSRI